MRAAGGRRPLRPPDASLEPKDAPLHLHGARRIYIIDLQKTSDLLEDAISSASWHRRTASVLSSARSCRPRTPSRRRPSRCACRTSTTAGLAAWIYELAHDVEPHRATHELRRLKEEDQLDAAAKERLTMLGELEKLEANLGSVADLKRQPDALFVLDLRSRSFRRGSAAGPADHWARRHELRPGRGRSRDPATTTRSVRAASSSARSATRSSRGRGDRPEFEQNGQKPRPRRPRRPGGGRDAGRARADGTGGVQPRPRLRRPGREPGCRDSGRDRGRGADA